MATNVNDGTQEARDRIYHISKTLAKLVVEKVNTSEVKELNEKIKNIFSSLTSEQRYDVMKDLRHLFRDVEEKNTVNAIAWESIIYANLEQDAVAIISKGHEVLQKEAEEGRRAIGARQELHGMMAGMTDYALGELFKLLPPDDVKLRECLKEAKREVMNSRVDEKHS